MQNAYKISAASLGDVSALEDLVNSAYRGDSSRKGWTTEADFLDGIRVDKPALVQAITAPTSVLLKYVSNSLILGCVNLEVKENELYIGMLTVSPDYQDQGIGALLLEACENYAVDKGIAKLSMTVISLRKELISWYERKGFKKTGKTLPFPDDPRFGIPKHKLQFLVMEKTIKGAI